MCRETYLSPFIRRCKDELFRLAQWDITRNNRLEIIKERKMHAVSTRKNFLMTFFIHCGIIFPKEMVEAKYLDMV